MKKSKQLQMLPPHQLELGVKLLMHDDCSALSDNMSTYLAGQAFVDQDQETENKLYLDFEDIKITTPEFSKFLSDIGLIAFESESTFLWEEQDRYYLFFYHIKKNYLSDNCYPAYTPEELKLTLLKRLNLNNTMSESECQERIKKEREESRKKLELEAAEKS